MKSVLLGKKNKRYEYFSKACRDLNVDFEFFDIDEYFENDLEKLFYENFSHQACFIKIDPISNYSIYVDELDSNITRYNDILTSLSNIEGILFMNSSESIKNTLDKIKCKQILQNANISTTPMLNLRCSCFDELIYSLREKNISQIFIKPNFGSGACGVISLKYNKKTDKIKIQTSMNYENDRYINTKKLFNISDKDMICKLVNFILKKGAIIERWIPKDDVNGIVYDLRLVYQFGKLDFIQARGSKNGSITNLHLNNLPLDNSSINLGDEIKQDIDTLCQKAMEQFPNLNVAGFDILLEKNTKKPYIIEINSQGDLMYKDIFYKNTIYKNQILKMNILVEKLKLK
ncbi:hypothetical protein HMPREF1142_1261 [Peptostreptococcaceae bacterium AS15]|nr:hypothetical protein HMPREF1142_1261 [Peptostreptococcaceae bacterium AS15]